MPNRIDPEKLEAARRLYIQYRGRRHRLIQSEMHALGFPTFTRRVFYSSKRNGEGWPTRFKWKDQLAGSPPYPRSEVDAPVSSQATGTKDPFQSWLQTVSPGMTWNWRHQLYLYDKLRAVTDGSVRRLMIFMPPRHGKSELVTVRYSAWRLHTEPTLNLILGSYNQRLANRFSRKVRGIWEDARNADAIVRNEGEARTIVRARTAGPSSGSAASSPIHHSSFDIHHSPSPSRRTRINTAAEWETFGGGGGVRAVGVGAGITGFGAGLVIIDDPVKSRAEAESPTFRERLWEWFNDDIYTRLEPNAAVILIQTRWHHDDLAGRLLREMAEEGGEQWDIVNLPALALGNEDSPVNADAPPRNADALVRNEGEARTVLSAATCFETSLKGAHSIARGKVKDRNPGIGTQFRPDPEGVEPSALLRLEEPTKKIAMLENPRSPIPNPQSPDPLHRRPGEALCPERYDEVALDRIRRKLGSYSFSALYQQSPVPLDGGLFNRGWFTRIVDRAPEHLRWCRGYDLAVSTKTSADYTASFRCALDRNTGILYIADGFRRRIEFPEQRRYILERLRTEPRTEHGIELALHGQAFLQELRRSERLASTAIRGVRVDTDKVTRALAWSARAEEGKVVLVRGPWIEDFLHELCQFPNGTHDDQVDAVSLAVQMLAARRRTGTSF